VDFLMPLLHLEALPASTTKGELLRFICSVADIGGDRICRIELRGSRATVEIPPGWEARLTRALDGALLRERPVHAWCSEGAPESAAVAGHFQRLARMLTLEAEAEARQTLENLRTVPLAQAEHSGHCLTGLVRTEEATGLGGRWIVTFARRDRSQLPPNRLEPGTPVLLSPDGGPAGEGRRGIVCERGPNYLNVSLDDQPEDEQATAYRIDRFVDEIARQRQLACLERVSQATRDRLAELRAVLLGEASARFASEATVAPLDDGLNAAQEEAVCFALAAQDVAIIHGPPGTGKTTAVVALIRQAVRRGEKVLACAPSNLAVDNVLERLLAHGEPAVRLGHPARVLPALREHTLDLMVEDHEDTRLARKLAKEAFALFRQAGKWTRAKPEPGSRQEMRQEARALLADARKLESQAVERILDQAAVLCATLTGLDNDLLGARRFDLVVIDEASQSTEPASWLPLLRGRRLVLAGDHRQLPPTVVSPEAAQAGFGVSLMERLVQQQGATITRRLDVQYRMHKAIMTFSSEQFYNGALQAHASVAGHLLRELPGVTANELTESPVHFIDTAGAGYDEETEPGGESRRNPLEAELVCRKVGALLEAGVPADTVAVIAPYAAQIRWLRDRLDVPGLEIDSFDGFQGREKEAVVLSLVRSNREGDVGFLADVRRMNVALTRARRKLIVIGDSATLACHPFYQSLLEYFELLGAYHSVWEEVE
jgi:hypothetical protein